MDIDTVRNLLKLRLKNEFFLFKVMTLNKRHIRLKNIVLPKNIYMA
jgi:hypothetical protein